MSNEGTDLQEGTAAPATPSDPYVDYLKQLAQDESAAAVSQDPHERRYHEGALDVLGKLIQLHEAQTAPPVRGPLKELIGYTFAFGYERALQAALDMLDTVGPACKEVPALVVDLVRKALQVLRQAPPLPPAYRVVLGKGGSK